MESEGARRKTIASEVAHPKRRTPRFAPCHAGHKIRSYHKNQQHKDYVNVCERVCPVCQLRLQRSESLQLTAYVQRMAFEKLGRSEKPDNRDSILSASSSGENF